MKLTQRVKKILAGYESDNPGTKANLARILMQGRLGGTGHLVFSPLIKGLSTALPAVLPPTRQPMTPITIGSWPLTPDCPP